MDYLFHSGDVNAVPDTEGRRWFPMYPKIETIDDFLPHIEGKSEFAINERDGFIVCCYRLVTPDTFPEGDAYSLEGRGIMFDSSTGKIIRRPLHKFFNVGEKAYTQGGLLNFSQATFYEKLDGSMIAPFRVKGAIRWGTKAGLSDVALMAEVFVSQRPEYGIFSEDMINNGYTPIFEFMSPENRIVLNYGEEPSMVLLAVRHMVSGRYMYPRELSTPSVLGIPTASTFPLTYKEAERECREGEGSEGYVVVLKGGYTVKMKLDWYIAPQRAKESVKTERRLVKLIAEGTIDDVTPLLDAETREAVSEFSTVFWYEISCLVLKYQSNHAKIIEDNISRADFSQYCKENNMDHLFKSLTFKQWGSTDVAYFEGICEWIHKMSSRSSRKAYENDKKSLGLIFHWKGWMSG